MALPPENVVFDRSLLPPADFEFVLLADTHYMREAASVEFASRRQQTARVEYALELIEALDPNFVIHMGDIVQSFPGSDDFEMAVAEASEQLEKLTIPCYHVAGNHDVGDKPDPTMPTEPVTRDSLKAYHERYGRSWYRWDDGGIDFLALNSQIMNADLAAATEQREWFETVLQSDVSEPAALLLHLPPFLETPQDPDIGHYDVIGQPARKWVFERIVDSPISHVFTAHTHFEFRTILDGVTFVGLPSPAFTRPGFAELFSSCPPPERGRDDTGKLGFSLVRVIDGEMHLHFIPTGGLTESNGRILLTPTTGQASASRLGVSLVHPFVETGRTPAVFPSVVQQPVHDAYPLLTCDRLGAGAIRLPVREVIRSRRSQDFVEHFRASGGTVIGTLQPSAVGRWQNAPIDVLELHVTGVDGLSGHAVSMIERVNEQAGIESAISIILPEHAIGGKQHDRLRTGYRPEELVDLDHDLAAHGTAVNRVLGVVSNATDPWETIREAPGAEDLDAIGRVDWLLRSIDLDNSTAMDRLARGMFATATRTAGRLMVEPLRELDRTMDAAPGVIDRRRNPTDSYYVATACNAVLGGDQWTVEDTFSTMTGGVIELTRDGSHVWLISPETNASMEAVLGDNIEGVDSTVQVIQPDPPYVITTEWNPEIGANEVGGPVIVVGETSRSR